MVACRAHRDVVKERPEHVIPQPLRQLSLGLGDEHRMAVALVELAPHIVLVLLGDGHGQATDPEDVEARLEVLVTAAGGGAARAWSARALAARVRAARVRGQRACDEGKSLSGACITTQVAHE